MIRANKMDRFMSVGFNTDLLPSMYEGCTTAPVKPEDTVPLNKKLCNLEVVSRGEIGVVPIKNSVNTMASENPNLPKITTPDEMLKKAMKPVGAGSTVFQPFNLLFNTNKSSDFLR